MKNLTTQTISIIFLVSLFFSCSERVENAINIDEYGINNSENRAALLEIINNPKVANELVYEIKDYNQVNEIIYTSSQNNTIDVWKALEDYELCDGCKSDYQKELISLFEILIVTPDNQILNV